MMTKAPESRTAMMMLRLTGLSTGFDPRGSLGTRRTSVPCLLCLQHGRRKLHRLQSSDECSDSMAPATAGSAPSGDCALREVTARKRYGHSAAPGHHVPNRIGGSDEEGVGSTGIDRIGPAPFHARVLNEEKPCECDDGVLPPWADRSWGSVSSLPAVTAAGET